jgi:hypothetical protein
VDAAHTRAAPNPELALRAQALIRSLAGVASARVTAGPAGIDAIHVVADDPRSVHALPGNVRSALLAGLATAVGPASITVQVLGQDEPTPQPDATATPRLGDDEHDNAAPADTAAATGFVGLHATDWPRLVAVDLERQPNGVATCRVTIVRDTTLHDGHATAAGTDAHAHAAARATLRALERAGIAGLRLEGVRQIDIGQRDYVLVALSHTDDPRCHRSGSILCSLSTERGAAEATIIAAMS